MGIGEKGPSYSLDKSSGDLLSTYFSPEGEKIIWMRVNHDGPNRIVTLIKAKDSALGTFFCRIWDAICHPMQYIAGYFGSRNRLAENWLLQTYAEKQATAPQNASTIIVEPSSRHFVFSPIRSGTQTLDTNLAIILTLAQTDDSISKRELAIACLGEKNALAFLERHKHLPSIDEKGQLHLPARFIPLIKQEYLSVQLPQVPAGGTEIVIPQTEMSDFLQKIGLNSRTSTKECSLRGAEEKPPEVLKPAVSEQPVPKQEEPKQPVPGPAVPVQGVPSTPPTTSMDSHQKKCLIGSIMLADYTLLNRYLRGEDLSGEKAPLEKTEGSEAYFLANMNRYLPAPLLDTTSIETYLEKIDIAREQIRRRDFTGTDDKVVNALVGPVLLGITDPELHREAALRSPEKSPGEHLERWKSNDERAQGFNISARPKNLPIWGYRETSEPRPQLSPERIQKAPVSLLPDFRDIA